MLLIFPTKVSRWNLKTFTEQLVDYNEWFNILHSLTFSMSLFPSLIIAGRAAVAVPLGEIR